MHLGAALISDDMEVELPIGLGGVKSYQTLTNSECHIRSSAVSPGVLRSPGERGTTQTIV
jgi:hypothetical protein